VLTETGRVVAVEQDGLWVETIRQSTCGSCTARSGCGHGLMNRIGEGKRGYIRVLPGDQQPGDCQIDDQVRISIPEEVILRGSFIVYMVPLFGMLSGAAFASSLAAGSDLAALIGAVAGFCAGVGVVRWYSHLHRNDSQLQPVLLEVLPATGTMPIQLS
jgi:sigma-E factor negative regulatory protein RseC